MQFVRRLVPLLILMFVVSACGGNDEGDAGPGKGTQDTGGVTVAPTAPPAMRLTSPAFADGQLIPREYSCQGAGTSPELSWSGVPEGATSLALVVHDPDAPVSGGFTHWVLYDIPRDVTGIPAGGTSGRTGNPAWRPPCPPSDSHRYVFTLYAFTDQPFAGVPDKAAVDTAAPRALASASVTGVYAKS